MFNLFFNTQSKIFNSVLKNRGILDEKINNSKFWREIRFFCSGKGWVIFELLGILNDSKGHNFDMQHNSIILQIFLSLLSLFTLEFWMKHVRLVL